MTKRAASGVNNMEKIEITDKILLGKIADMENIPSVGAYNIRKNSASAGRRNTENIEITNKTDKQGIDIHIKPNTKSESVHIPVIINASGVEEVVYNDFYIGDDCDITIVAGCGIHNDGCDNSRHDGVHRFFIGKNAKVKYIEKHYAEGKGSGEKIMNPVTKIYVGEGSVCELEMLQLGGVDKTKRDTYAKIEKNAKIIITERLLTLDNQVADSDMVTELVGENAVAQIISRSVAKGNSYQIFRPKAVGNAKCKAHVQCDSIICDNAKIASVPEIAANHPEANLIHEAAIGRINNDQLLKLMTLGIPEDEAEDVIIQGFLGK